MELNDDTWHGEEHAARHGLHRRQGDKPAPLTDAEANAILERVEEGGEKPTPKTLFEAGELVRVIDGPFNDFNGVVEEVNYEKSRSRAVTIFGRSTPVELDFGQVERLIATCGRDVPAVPEPKVVRTPDRQDGSEHAKAPRRLAIRHPPGTPRRMLRRLRGPRTGARLTIHEPTPAGPSTTGSSRRVAERSTRGVEDGQEDPGLHQAAVPAGQANPSPPVGPALGQHGVNIMEFCKAFNAETQGMEQGLPLPVVITVYADRSFTFIKKTPPASVLLKKAAGLKSGSGRPNTEKVGKVTRAQVEEIAQAKMPDLTASDLEAAVRTIAGSARSAGIEVEGL